MKASIETTIQDPAYADPICTDGIERLRIRVHPSNRWNPPTLIYLPGIHGDWTLIGAFREGLQRRACFVDMTYPRTTRWSLQDYATAIEEGLRGHGIQGGWLLGESFGSQVLWELAARKRFRISGLILAGGFVRYPYPALVAWARGILPHVSHRMLLRLLPAYVMYAKFRHSGSPISIQGARDFVVRRNHLDKEAILHRLRLIEANDPREVARTTPFPVHHLYGAIDPIVPWPPVGGWLRKNCPSLRGSRRVLASDHTILATAAESSVEQVCQWIA